MNVVSLPMTTDDPCAGCGVCCATQGSPPGFSVFFPYGEYNPSPAWLARSEFADWVADRDAVVALPAIVRDALAAYYLALNRDDIDDRYDDGLPCLWYDEVAKRCRHYEHRPSACREFEAGGEDCLEMKKGAGLP